MDKQLQALQHNLEAAVQRAMDSCAASGHAIYDHFRGITKMVVHGKRWVSDRFATRRVANPIVAVRKATAEKSPAARNRWRTLP